MVYAMHQPSAGWKEDSGHRLRLVWQRHSRKVPRYGCPYSVYDTDPVYLLKAKVDGHHVSEDLNELIAQAEVIVTSTGRFHVITKEHIPFFSDGLLLSNAGHFGFEIDTDDLRTAADRVEAVGAGKEALWFGQKKVFLLENANPLNLSAGDGNPIPSWTWVWDSRLSAACC